MPEAFKGTRLFFVVGSNPMTVNWAIIEILSGHLVDPEAAVFLCGSMEQRHEFHGFGIMYLILNSLADEAQTCSTRVCENQPNEVMSRCFPFRDAKMAGKLAAFFVIK